MAEEKTSFVLYSDLIHTVEKMPSDKAGDLFKHILRYVNDLNPETDCLITNLTFEPIKQSLKRDLKKFEAAKIDKSFKARIGNLKRWSLDLYEQYSKGTLTLEEAENIAKHRRATTSDKNNPQVSLDDSVATKNIAEIAVSDSVTVSVSDSVSVILLEKETKESMLKKRKLAFASTLEPFVETYGKEMLNDFYKYWTEPNKTQTKFKQELEKTWSLDRRLESWASRDKNFQKNTNNQNNEPTIIGRQTESTVNHNYNTFLQAGRAVFGVNEE